MSRIPLRVSNQKAYVWDVDDIAILRAKHHICGVLTGTLAGVSQQNVFLGVPLVLLPEEVVLLVQNEIAVLVDDPRAHIEAPIGDVEAWNAERRQAAKIQITMQQAKEASKETSSRAMSEAAIRKRREREEKRKREHAKAEEAALTEGTTPLFVPEPPRPATPTVDLSNATYTISIPASSKTLQWYNPDPSCVHSTLESAAHIWSYPQNDNERAKCGVFRSLWEQGFFMGVGMKFGGDYLVYPGDPLRYHSHFTASVVDSPTSVLRPMEIVAHGRLGTATKKSHLLCGWDNEKQETTYYSIEWSGFG